MKVLATLVRLLSGRAVITVELLDAGFEGFVQRTLLLAVIAVSPSTYSPSA